MYCPGFNIGARDEQVKLLSIIMGYICNLKHLGHKNMKYINVQMYIVYAAMPTCTCSKCALATYMYIDTCI